jgi:RNA polymerase-binding transcription factor DksA
VIDTESRTAQLRQILMDHRCDVQEIVRGWISQTRTDRAADRNLELLLCSEMLTQIDDAMVRLEGETYGWCTGCGRDIAERRLRELPFTARCETCDLGSQQAGGDAQELALARGEWSPAPDVPRIDR